MSSNKLDKYIRVNHAGEYGAVRIYQGQIDAMKHKKASNLTTIRALKDMYIQEQKHLLFFEKELVERRIRPTILQPLWHVLGYALGYATAKIGEEAAMTATVAIEEVIDQHYAHQIDIIENDAALKSAIETIREDELEHRDIALKHNPQAIVAYPLIKTTIQIASRAAIWLSKNF
jgi:ubiquinone biosynthesis monooxygenase Coq7